MSPPRQHRTSNRQPQDKEDPTRYFPGENGNQVKRRGYYSQSDGKVAATKQYTSNANDRKKSHNKAENTGLKDPKNYDDNRTDKKNIRRHTVAHNDPKKPWADYSSSEDDDYTHKKKTNKSFHGNDNDDYKKKNKYFFKGETSYTHHKKNIVTNYKNATTTNKKLGQFHRETTTNNFRRQAFASNENNYSEHENSTSKKNPIENTNKSIAKSVSNKKFNKTISNESNNTSIPIKKDNQKDATYKNHVHKTNVPNNFNNNYSSKTSFRKNKLAPDDRNNIDRVEDSAPEIKNDKLKDSTYKKHLHKTNVPNNFNNIYSGKTSFRKNKVAPDDRNDIDRAEDSAPEIKNYNQKDATYKKHLHKKNVPKNFNNSYSGKSSFCKNKVAPDDRNNNDRAEDSAPEVKNDKQKDVTYNKKHVHKTNVPKNVNNKYSGKASFHRNTVAPGDGDRNNIDRAEVSALETHISENKIIKTDKKGTQSFHSESKNLSKVIDHSKHTKDDMKSKEKKQNKLKAEMKEDNTVFAFSERSSALGEMYANNNQNHQASTKGTKKSNSEGKSADENHPKDTKIDTKLITNDQNSMKGKKKEKNDKVFSFRNVSSALGEMHSNREPKNTKNGIQQSHGKKTGKFNGHSKYTKAETKLKEKNQFTSEIEKQIDDKTISVLGEIHASNQEPKIAKKETQQFHSKSKKVKATDHLNADTKVDKKLKESEVEKQIDDNKVSALGKMHANNQESNTKKKEIQQFQSKSKKAKAIDFPKADTKVDEKLKENEQNKSESEKQVDYKKKNSSKKDVHVQPGKAKKINPTKTYSKSQTEAKGPNDTIFAEHLTSEQVLQRYQQRDPKLIRGRLHVTHHKGLYGPAYVSCDRGSISRDVCIKNYIDRNRGMNGDYVYVELLSNDERPSDDAIVKQFIKDMDDSLESSESFIDDDGDDDDNSNCPSVASSVSWNDDDMQHKLWNPTVDVGNVKMKHDLLKHKKQNRDEPEEKKRFGRVVHVVPPSCLESVVSGSDLLASKPDRKSLIGKITRNQKGVYHFHPEAKYLTKFTVKGDTKVIDGSPTTLYHAEYVYGSWVKKSFDPCCCNVKNLGKSYDPVNETLALLFEHGIDHGDFSPEVLRDVDNSVKSGMSLPNPNKQQSTDLEWRPSPEMCRGRKDYTKTRIFTIDPTDAKDLDDALHITRLEGDKVEIGVHIADVSHFVTPGTHLDAEAESRATTVYLVDQTIPMLPRPLCEIACSLNENVERLTFSCVWQMNLDGTLCKDKSGKEKIWYGKSVIKSCARLDYDTAQNIIEGKVANGDEKIDDELWPKSRRPSGGHKVQDVANDVRLMNQVAMARRKLRFENGALAFGRTKLRFLFRDKDRKQKKSNSKLAKLPFRCEPYIMKDSNRLVEEYMLLANYLVAQQIIMHAGDLAVLRRHPPPERGLSEVVDAAKIIGFHIDCSSSRKLHQSLCKFSRECADDILVQCITEMLSLPMKPAKYFATGCVDKEQWSHFALNIPYYTHFTSPIRRYPDILVHRLLQATLEGKKSVSKFPKSKVELHETAKHCNSKHKTAKSAQEQSDRIFLSLYLKHHPIQRALAVVIKVKQKEFIVFVPELGVRQIICKSDNPGLDFNYLNSEESIVLKPKNKEFKWDSLKIKMFTKLHVVCTCQSNSPDIKLKLHGPWKDE